MNLVQAKAIMFWNADETDASNADNVLDADEMQATRIGKLR